MQRGRVRQRMRVRPVDHELLDHHVPSRIRYGRRGRAVTVAGRGRAPAVAPGRRRIVARLVGRQWLRRAPTELTVPLSFYLVISFLLLLVLVQIVQHVVQYQVVTVLVLSLKRQRQTINPFIQVFIKMGRKKIHNSIMRVCNIFGKKLTGPTVILKVK